MTTKSKRPSYLSDIGKYIDSVVYGKVTLQPIQVIRNHKKTVMIEMTAQETLEYTDYNSALEQSLAYVLSLIDQKFNGEAAFRMTMKDGNISLIAYESKKQTQYGRSKNKK